MYIFCFTLFLIYLTVGTPIVKLTKKGMLPATLDFLQEKVNNYYSISVSETLGFSQGLLPKKAQRK